MSIFFEIPWPSPLIPDPDLLPPDFIRLGVRRRIKPVPAGSTGVSGIVDDLIFLKAGRNVSTGCSGSSPPHGFPYMAGKMRRGPDPAPSFPRMSKPCKECKEIHNQPRFISVKVPLFLPGFQQKRCPQVSPVMRDLPRPFYRAALSGWHSSRSDRIRCTAQPDVPARPLT